MFEFVLETNSQLLTSTPLPSIYNRSIKEEDDLIKSCQSMSINSPNTPIRPKLENKQSLFVNSIEQRNNNTTTPQSLSMRKHMLEMALKEVIRAIEISMEDN